MERLQSQTVVDYSATCVFVYESDCVCVGDCVRASLKDSYSGGVDDEMTLTGICFTAQLRSIISRLSSRARKKKKIALLCFPTQEI